MSLTAYQIQLVQESFAKVEPIAERAAEIFYAELFNFNPELKLMFNGNMSDQGKKLMTTLKVAVKGLDNLPGIVPVLEQLAERHVKYGVRPSDYTTVGNALLVTLKKGLGDEFTAETRQAWIALYKLVANVMKQHAYGDWQ